MDNLGLKAIVSGKVQGVGFRYYTAQKANELGVYGHAKNLANGDVEVMMFANKTQLTLLLKWLEKGPKMSVVTNLEVSDIDYMELTNFSCY